MRDLLIYPRYLTISNPIRPEYGFRETFGIIDPLTKEVYKDIKSSFLLTRVITIEDLYNSSIKEASQDFLLHVDDKLWFRILRNKQENCIVSYQIRTNGNFALARLFIER